MTESQSSNLTVKARFYKWLDPDTVFGDMKEVADALRGIKITMLNQEIGEITDAIPTDDYVEYTIRFYRLSPTSVSTESTEGTK